MSKLKKIECNDFLIKTFGSQGGIDMEYSGTILGLEDAFKANEPYIEQLETKNKNLMDLLEDCIDDLKSANKDNDNMMSRRFIVSRLDYYHEELGEINK